MHPDMLKTWLQQYCGLGYTGQNEIAGSYQFTYEADFDTSLIQNRNKMNLFYTSATSSKSFATIRFISVLHMAIKATDCLEQTLTGKSMFSVFTSN